LDGEPAVYLITGIQAAGKSTVAEHLAARFDRSAHVREVFSQMIISGRAPMEPDASAEAERQLDLRYELAAATADRFAQEGFVAVVQDNIFGEHLPRFVERITFRPLHVVVLTPRPEVVAEREATREKTAYRSGSWTIEGLDRALREETPRIGLWLDNSDQTPKETVDEILRRSDETPV
jgi:hypothetical protein